MSEFNYYGNVNGELLRWIPLTAKRVLELGCGEAALAAVYKMRNPTVDYVAVEAHGPAAAVAKTRVDRLVEADFLALTPKELEELGLFDVIVLGDVLEHFPDPWALLKILRSLLSERGRIALSVPNISHWSGLASLISGSWPATDDGLFDRTHLRFFTLESLTRVLVESGFVPERIRPRMYLLDATEAERWMPILADAAERAGQDRAAFLQRAQTIQYVVTAHRSDAQSSRVHVHFAALAPDFMDARTRLPFNALDSEPSLSVSYQERKIDLPKMPLQTPKVAIFQRLLIRDELGWKKFVWRARSFGWLLVYEIDDHPDLIGRVHQGGTMSEQIRTAIARGCHGVQTSTPKLAEVLRKLNPEVAVFENAVMELPPLQPRPKGQRVFYGALNRETFSAQVAAALAPAIAARPELEFVVVHDRAFFDALPTVRKIFHSGQPYDGYLKLMAECDIVLSPLEGREEETFKSDIKFLEASRCGAAMIASPCVYEDSIQDGHTGLIARTLEDWSAQLAKLAGDPELRDRIARAAWTEVRDNRMMAGQVAARRDWYHSLYARRHALDAALVGRWPAEQP